MSENLVIVESPAKAKTIEKFLGKDFKVMSSFGHVRDLPKKNDAIDIANNFEPTYVISDDKKKIVASLKQAVKQAQMVWLASDEDREGEAIAWHLSEALNLKKENTKRIVFHEITKTAILKAITNPRGINYNLVNGQQARRVLDRLVGFELSPVLWKKIKTGLSAGRVQSVAVRLVVEREREIDKFAAQSTFRIGARLETAAGEVFGALLPQDKPDIDEALQYIERNKNSEFRVHSVEQKPGKRSPAAPFTTSTLQQAASVQLGFSVRQTMVVAQRLYESGKITYMRTDSLTLSAQALEQAKSWIHDNLSARHYQARVYKTKSASAQEAHEAIRPTALNDRNITGEKNEQRLYDLIWRRTVASQMSDAQTLRTTAKIAVSNDKEMLLAKGEVIVFAGFLDVMGKSKKDEDTLLPSLTVGDDLILRSLRAQEYFSRPPARFTEAGLVKKLEELGIGRPSTYAPTISTIQNRGYVEKGESPGEERQVRILALRADEIVREDKTEMTGSNKGRLVPLAIAGVVTDFLIKYFSEVVDYNFTAKVESQFDDIVAGNTGWQKMISDFYFPFHQDVEKAEQISRSEANQARSLGVDAQSGKPVSVRIGSYGPFAQIGEGDDVRFASLRNEHKLETVTLDEVLPLFDLPRNLGQTEDNETVIVNTGRFGPYAQYVNQEIEQFLAAKKLKGIEMVAQNVSIGEEEPLTVSLDKVAEFITDKKKIDSEKEIKLFVNSPVQVLEGRWGPFITDGLKNAKIPKDRKPESLTLEECVKILEETKKEKKRLTKSYHGGGFSLLREVDGVADATLKVKAGKEKQANEIADELANQGYKIRLISARGATLIRQAEKRAQNKKNKST